VGIIFWLFNCVRISEMMPSDSIKFASMSIGSHAFMTHHFEVEVWTFSQRQIRQNMTRSNSGRHHRSASLCIDWLFTGPQGFSSSRKWSTIWCWLDMSSVIFGGFLVVISATSQALGTSCRQAMARDSRVQAGWTRNFIIIFPKHSGWLSVMANRFCPE
jgi:hypothetical protein